MAGVVALLGELPPEVITADVIRGLVAPNGALPCADGIAAGLSWIGDRALPLAEAVREAEEDDNVREYVDWALDALGSGDGSGYGSGSGFGYGSGDGSGYGY